MGASCELPCPGTGAWTHAILKIGLQHPLPPALSATTSSKGIYRSCCSTPLSHTFHFKKQHPQRKGRTGQAWVFWALSTPLSIRAGGSQEKDSGEFGQISLFTPPPSALTGQGRIVGPAQYTWPCPDTLLLHWTSTTLQNAGRDRKENQAGAQDRVSGEIWITKPFLLQGQKADERRQFE